MFEEFWGPASLPFRNLSDIYIFFLSPQHRDAVARRVYAEGYDTGVALLPAEVGCGKTTVARPVVQLAGERHHGGVVTNSSLPPRDFLEEITLRSGRGPTGLRTRRPSGALLGSSTRQGRAVPSLGWLT